MSVADIFNFPATEQDTAQWSILHMILHRSQLREVFLRYNTVLQEYVLDPIPTDDPRLWLQQHQQMHNDVDAVLGLSSENLTEVDWEDQGSKAGWIQAHAQLHQQETNALGITA
jgi:hypothetical protein